MTASSATLERTHRFALSISGGVALGSYEAGVLSQLYRDLHAFNAAPDMQGRARVTIDAIAGASAGSITGLILAQAIALGDTPDDLEKRMRDCWIELLDIQHLLKPSPGEAVGDAIFTGSVVEEIVQTSLRIPPPATVAPHEPIALWITMTNLDGVPFVIDFERKHHAQTSTALYALDYRDSIPFLITGSDIRMVEDRMVVQEGAAGAGGASDAIWSAAVEAARASSAFPVAFPSQYQERNLLQYPEYVAFKQAVESNRLASKTQEPDLLAQKPLPDTAWFQFVDGGLFNNEPIGKCVDAVNYLNARYPERDPNSAQSQGRVGRSFVIIEPDPQLPADVEQALLRSTPHTENPSLPASVLAKILSAYFNSALYGDFKTAANINRRIRSLNAALEKLDTLGLDAQQAAALKAEIRQAVGLQDKSEITLQRVPHDLPTTKRLAGAFGGHFGGFLRKDFREADFITGRHEARQWFQQWLTKWLQSHAGDVGSTSDKITPEYTLTLLGPAPPDPAATPVPPTNLTPAQLANSGWFPGRDANGQVSGIMRLAALTEDQRKEIVQLAEARGEALLDAWLHVPNLARFPAHVVLAAVEHLFNGRFINDPSPE
jgi:predicted acylesterase/phospholipase RssA